MTGTEPSSHAPQPEASALRARIALGVKMLTTAGYSMIGGAVFRPLVEAHRIGSADALWGAGGAAALALAIFLAPDGEAPRE